MATIEPYKGLDVLQNDGSAQPGGKAISQNFRTMVDWHPQSNWAATGSPGVDDDVDAGYYPGSFWLDTSGTPELWVCVSNASGAASWHSVG